MCQISLLSQTISFYRQQLRAPNKRNSQSIVSHKGSIFLGISTDRSYIYRSPNQNNASQAATRPSFGFALPPTFDIHYSYTDMTTQNPHTSKTKCTSVSPPHLSGQVTGTGTAQPQTLNPPSPGHPFPRPPRPSKIRQTKQTLHDDLTSMGFIFDEPLLHTRHSVALRYADGRAAMAAQRAELGELPFGVEGWTPPPSAGLLRRVNENEVVRSRAEEWDGWRGRSKGRRIEYIQTMEESRALRRTRRPTGEMEREKFERLLGGSLPEGLKPPASMIERRW